MFALPSSQRATSFPSGSQPSLAPHTARRPTRFSPSATLWGFPTSRPSGNIRCPTTGTRTMSACTPTSPPSAEPSWTWCTSSSGERSLWCMTTAQVQVQSLSVFFFWCRSCLACMFATSTPRISVVGEQEHPGELQETVLLGVQPVPLLPVKLIQKSIAYCFARVRLVLPLSVFQTSEQHCRKTRATLPRVTQCLFLLMQQQMI